MKNLLYALLVAGLISCATPAFSQQGTGLSALYSDPTGRVASVSRVDAQVNLPTISAPAAMPANYTAVWQGQLAILHSGSYVFGLTSAGGGKVYVNGQLAVNDYIAHPKRTVSGSSISLASGTRVSIEVDYFSGAIPSAILTWQTPTGPGGSLAASHSVPGTQLYPTPVVGPSPSPSPTPAPVLPPGVIPPIVAPTNLRVSGQWLATNQPTDTIAWDAVPGTVSYNVYQYAATKPMVSGLTAPTYQVPASAFNASLTYQVTAVDAKGNKTLQSAPAGAQGLPDPRTPPSFQPSAPSVPDNVQAVGEWNDGKARIHVSWSHGMQASTYNVYRNGVLAAAGLWGQNYYDNNVNAGDSHVYSISAVNCPWKISVESAESAGTTGTAPSGPPPVWAGTIPVTVTPNDDSVVVSFPAVPGAIDYRVFDPANTADAKYSGGSLSIEFNGLNPAKLIVQALDKLGPVQFSDGMPSPGGSALMVMPNMPSTNTNGQGDPSNVPNVIAQSAPVQTFFVPLSSRITGTQVFSDDFFTENPLVPVALPAGTAGPDSNAFGNDKWTFYNLLCDTKNTVDFFMGHHFMDTLFDGGTQGGNNPMHQSNASMVMLPKATVDISGGKVLHVSFEVDAHFGTRRWIDVLVYPAADTLLAAGKIFQSPGGPDTLPTTSGNLFRWEITAKAHDAQLFEGWKYHNVKGQLDTLNAYELYDEINGVGSDNFGPAARITYNGIPLANGTTFNLDKRSRFDLYLSETHYQMRENGIIVKDKDFPSGVKLPFTSCQVGLDHLVYHTAQEHPDLVGFYPQERYWLTYRPFADERHWCDYIQESLPSFPK